MVLAHVVHMECMALPCWAHVSHTWGPYMFCSQTDLLPTWAKYIGYPHANWQCHVVYTWVPIYKFTYACHMVLAHVVHMEHMAFPCWAHM